MTSVALLGAGGTMGRGMARNLAVAGIQVRAWNRTQAKVKDLAAEERIEVFATPAEAAGEADAILTMLADADAVLAAMEGPDGAAAAAAPGSTWIQMSTIGIAGTERCAQLASRHQLTFVDAPVLGTKQPAEEGQLVVLASGPEKAKELVQPIFDAVGKKTIWVGEAGAGSRLKVVVNAWIVTVVEGTAEMLALAEGIGVDPRLVLEAIEGGPLDLPYMRVKAKAMLERDFTPSFKLGLAAKDARLAVQAADLADLELPMLTAIAEQMTEAAREHGEEDLAAVYLATASTT
ncbi:MAG TPA: NAD(P)-dependent oxidoreductase [Solirubrobacterales bacterium]